MVLNKSIDGLSWTYGMLTIGRVALAAIAETAILVH